MKNRTYFLLVVIFIFSLLVLLGGTTYVIDPFFHYRKPADIFSYDVAAAEYKNDGISRNFDYNAMITGPCMTSGFKVSQADMLFDKKFVRITYLGEGFYRIGKNVRRAIAGNDQLEMVIWSVDPIWYVTDEDYEGYDSYPEYLLNDDYWDDVNYLFNGEIFMGETLPEIIRSIQKQPSKSFDAYADLEEGNRESLLAQYERHEKENRGVIESETKEMMAALERNIDGNIVSVVKENPDIEFYFFIPPLSILWWDDLNQTGTQILLRRIDLEQMVIEKILPYDNVKLFAFEDEFSVTCDLNLYNDSVHYSDEVNDFMLQRMYEQKNLLTTENYQEYLERIREFYLNYDYDKIFETDGKVAD